ncbi:acetyltransferase [Corallococcus coralloides DSM 2259]|uniref:Acetyltransferase n=1 Tax=Corallococcus coralloides (strain ATCC 25202 / DSM 2259 / NBRC 100086 / M2) TaxID=1144275 RepID=H8MIX7_CORCM|nr:GNAT family N-acetyltransferase [Corallococcus coralloides]AFE11057.1 acetyltransferase [Corallococcus coralloides DSM 2259]
MLLQHFERTTTDRLLLRAVRENDLDAVFALHSDPTTNRFSRHGYMETLDDARRVMGLWLEDWARDGVGYWLVERLEAPGVVVGLGGLRHKELEGQRVLNLAYRFTPETRGSGYATEVSRVALALAARHLPHVPLVAIIHPENAASIRVAERLGMRLDRHITEDDIQNRVYVIG